jgi:hypothetical protein
MTAGCEAVRIGGMLTPPEIRRRLREGAAAAFRGDEAVLAGTASWLASASARELLRIDQWARRFRADGPTLGNSVRWTGKVLASPSPAVAALAGMHPDGYVRERALRSLAAARGALSDRALAVRVSDHVPVIRETAAREVLSRTTLAHADHLVPLLHRIEQRGRGADVLPLYLRTLVMSYGEEPVWARLRGSADRDLRRVAFRRSFAAGLIGPADAVALLRGERDQAVRRQFTRVIAGSAAPEVITRVLLRSRSAEGRVLALLKLTAAELDPADVARLLVDSSVLVRLWARRRWQELGRDPVAVYVEVARSTAGPAVRARAYTGLAETSTTIDREEILGLVRSAELPLRKVGLSLLRERATAEDVPLLLDAVAGGDSRLARQASEVLAAGPRLWSLPDLAPLKTAADPVLRRRAWWLHRQLGGWEAVIADLELLTDPDPRLAALAWRTELPMYFHPTGAQRQRIAALLATIPADRRPSGLLTVAAGLSDPA